MTCLDLFSLCLFYMEVWTLRKEWQRTANKHIPSSVPKSWNEKMGHRQDFTHLSLAVSQSPSGLTVGNKIAELRHLDIQVGESKIHHLVKEATDPANYASMLGKKMSWWDIAMVCEEFSELKCGYEKNVFCFLLRRHLCPLRLALEGSFTRPILQSKRQSAINILKTCANPIGGHKSSNH